MNPRPSPARLLLAAALRRRCAAGLVGLVLGLLLGQGVGLLHRTVHGGAVARVAVHDLQAHVHGPAQDGGWFDDHGEGSDECRLIDQLSLADALLPSTCVPALVVATVLVGHWVPTVPALQPLAAHRARGPPPG